METDFLEVKLAAKSTPQLRRNSLVFLAICVLVFLDQWTKVWATHSLQSSSPTTYLGVFTLRYALNSGAFLSLGAQLGDQWRFYLFTVSVGLFLLYALYKLFLDRTLSLGAILAFLFLVAGGGGNWIDRVLYHTVRDFMVLHYGMLTTGIFNLADTYIVMGLIVYFFEAPIERWQKSKSPKSNVATD